jgi:predicted GIY-YIG superfamily endonuclease
MWYVYLITDPTTQRALYVGMTSNMENRRVVHTSSNSGPIRRYMDALGKLKYNSQIMVVAYFDDKEAAAESERRLIAAIPNLLNKRVRASSGRPKTIGGEPWKAAGVSRSQWFRRQKPKS